MYKPCNADLVRVEFARDIKKLLGTAPLALAATENASPAPTSDPAAEGTAEEAAA